MNEKQGSKNKTQIKLTYKESPNPPENYKRYFEFDRLCRLGVKAKARAKTKTEIKAIRHFRKAGKYLASIVPKTVEPRGNEKELRRKINQLREYIASGLPSSVWYWFWIEYPNSISCLPMAEMDEFFRGVQEVYRDKSFDWFNFNNEE